MAAMNVGGAVTPALSHTGRVLFRPFALRKWLALGFVSLVAGFAEGGGGHFNVPSGDSSGSDQNWEAVGAWIVAHLALIIAGAILLFLVGLAFQWLGSVMKFVYMNQVTRDPYAIREPFRRFIPQGTSFFLWNLAFGLVMLLTLGILVGIPIALIFAMELTHNVAAIVVVAVWCLLILLATITVAAVIDIFARDFVSTAMFVRRVGVMAGWRMILPLLGENKGQSALYVLMLIAISLAMGIGALFAVLAVGLVFAVVGGLFALIGYGIYVAGGHTWSAMLISYAVVIGTLLLLTFSYALTCAVQPLEVFRRVFSLVVVGQAEPSLATIPSE